MPKNKKRVNIKKTPVNKKKNETKELLITLIGALLVLALVIGLVVACIYIDKQKTPGNVSGDYSNMQTGGQPAAPTIEEEQLGKPTHTATLVIENYGTITMELYGNLAPKTVENFVSLAESGFYDGLTFHRIIEGFMMQGGAPKGEDKTATIPGEFDSNGFDNPLAHTRGVISMARTDDPNSASSQFFIMHDDAPHLDGKYAAFGFVTSGIEVVDRICSTAQPIDGNGSIATSAQPVITSLTVKPVE